MNVRQKISPDEYNTVLKDMKILNNLLIKVQYNINNPPDTNEEKLYRNLMDGDPEFEVYCLAKKIIFSIEDWKIIAHTNIDKTVTVRASNKFPEESYFIKTITSIPRTIQQRLAKGNATSWENQLVLYNKYSGHIIKEITLLDFIDEELNEKVRIIVDRAKQSIYGDTS